MKDLPHLQYLTKRAKSILLVPDSEENEAGIKGAMDTAADLETAGKSAFIVIIPRPEGVEKVDATDFLRDQGKDALDKLIKDAKTPLQLEIDHIARKGLNSVRLSDRLSSVKEKLARLPWAERAAIYDYMKTVLNLKADFLKAFQREVRSVEDEDDCEVDGEGPRGKFCACFPELVDFVDSDGRILYLVKADEGLQIVDSVEQGDVVHIPPNREAIPFSLVPGHLVLKHFDSDEATGV